MVMRALYSYSQFNTFVNRLCSYSTQQSYFAKQNFHWTFFCVPLLNDNTALFIKEIENHKVFNILRFVHFSC